MYTVKLWAVAALADDKQHFYITSP